MSPNRIIFITTLSIYNTYTCISFFSIIVIHKPLKFVFARVASCEKPTEPAKIATRQIKSAQRKRKNVIVHRHRNKFESANPHKLTEWGGAVVYIPGKYCMSVNYVCSSNNDIMPVLFFHAK